MENNPKKSDRELAEELKQRDEAAFNEAVNRFIRPVYSICLKCLGDPTEAQDATQEVFLRMYKSIGSFDPNRPLSSWLFKIAYNRCMDRLKKRGRNPEHQVEELEATAPPSEPPLDLEDEGDRMRRILWEAVDELPEGYRLMILFKYRFGMKNAEIAEVMGITENNLRVKLYRAKNELRSAVRRKLQEGAE
ncbi:MAG: hypothetical protein DRQ02_13305 [Candidatus Latescibacterota bacterium]|nr:MAG: hypothetical protein DRQ02_13305 [Candidatus Latescibacterota bacterium]